MSSKATSPGTVTGRSRLRQVFHSPGPDALIVLLLLIIAIVCAALIGLGLGTL